MAIRRTQKSLEQIVEGRNEALPHNEDGSLNYAKLQKQLDTNPTMEMCRRMGGTHAAYEWACNPPGHFTPEQCEEYRQGFAEMAESKKRG